MSDTNLITGIGLSTFGTILALGSYLLLQNVPLTAMGIGIIVIGTTWALTPPNPTPKKALLDLVKSSCSNIEALLEATGATNKAIYIPARDNKIIAYIPLKNGDNITLQTIAENNSKILIRQGKTLGIAIIPPNIGQETPNPETEPNIDAQLDHILIETLEIAENIKTARSENTIIVQIHKPKIDIDYPRFKMIMGSLPSSLIAQAIATATSRPVKIIQEKTQKNTLTIQLRLLNWTDTPSTL
ncbi:MAG: hypothetical protein ACP5IZ_09335 [Thermoprotei archaeon]|jgi:hypothetical protein